MDLKDDYLTRLKYLTMTFVAIVIGSTIGLGAFRWVFAIQFHLINESEFFWENLMPIALLWIPVVIWFRPRVKIITFDKDWSYRDPKTVLYFTVWLTSIGMSMNLQEYITTASGKLIQAKNLRDIVDTQDARYYKITNYFIDTDHTGEFVTVEQVSQRHGGGDDVSVYIVAPIIFSPVKEYTDSNTYWIGVRYDRHIDNTAQQSKAEGTAEFKKSSIADFKANSVSIDHFEKSTRDEWAYEKAVA